MAVLAVAGCQVVTVDPPGAPDSGRWRIVARVGPVVVQRPGRSFWQRARPGEAILPGSRVATTRGGAITLASADDVISASDRSRLEVVHDEPEETVIRQDRGRVRYRVRSAPGRRFEVETPYLATVVKGTIFEVAVGVEGATVELEEGRVWAAPPGRRPGAELTPGQAARAAPGSPVLEVRRDPGGPFEAMPEAATTAHPGRSAKAANSPALGEASATASSRVAKPSGPAVQAATPPPSLIGRLRAGFARMAFGLHTAWRDERRDGAQVQTAPRADQAISVSGTASGKASQASGGGHGGGPGGGKGGSPGAGKGGGHGGGKGGSPGAGKGGGHGGGKGGGPGGGKGGGPGGGKGGGPGGGKGGGKSRASHAEGPGRGSRLL